MSPSQQTRLIVESFQRGSALKDFRAASAAANRADLATAPTGTDYNAIQEFETKVNAPDYPKELKDLYYLGKSKNDYKDFNEKVTKYNTEQKAAYEKQQAEVAKWEKDTLPKLPKDYQDAYKAKDKDKMKSLEAQYQKESKDFEDKVNSPDYPAELKEAYKKSKESGDFTTFEGAVRDYESKNNVATGYYEPPAEVKQPEYTPETAAWLEEYSKYSPAASKEAEIARRETSGVIQVGTSAGKPEYISKYDYDAIAAADKANGTKYLDVLKEKGVTGLNAAVNVESEQSAAEQKVREQQQADFEKSIGSPEYPKILRDIYYQGKKDNDFTKFNDAIDSWNVSQEIKIKEFNQNNHVIDGIGIPNEDWNTLHPELKKIAEKEGFQVMFDSLDLWEKNRLTAPKWYRESVTSPETLARIDKTMQDLEPYKETKHTNLPPNVKGAPADLLGTPDQQVYYDLIKYLDDIKMKTYYETASQRPLKGVLGKAGAVKTVGTSPDWNGLRQQLIEAGFDEKYVDDSIYQAKLDPVQRFWQGSTPWNEQKGETVTFGKGVQMAAEWLVPGVYTGVHWNEMSAGQKAMNLLVDVLSVGFPAGRAAVLGAREVAGTATRAGVMAAAGKGFALGAARAIVPIDLILHPLGAAKASAADLRTLAEDLANPNKLPIMSVHTSEGTVRLAVSKDISVTEAKAMRDKLMQAVQRGERVIVELKDGRIIELRRSALMKELPGSFAHTTPQGEAFELGTVSKTKYREVDIIGPTGEKISTRTPMPKSEQGIFYAPDPLPRFAKTSAFGKAGAKPAIIITSPETSAKLISTEKIYAGTAEMESKLPVGKGTKPIGQRFYTRLADGTRVEIWLEEGLKLSPKQVLKLKAKGIIETIAAPFSPALKIKGGRIKGSGLIPADVDYLANELRRAGANGEARNLLRVQQQLVTARAAIPRVTLRAGQGIMQIRRGMGEREIKRGKVVLATRRTPLSREELQSRVKKISTKRAPSLRAQPFRNTNSNRTIEQAERVTEKATRDNGQQRTNPENNRKFDTARTFETNRVQSGERDKTFNRVQTGDRVPPTNRTKPASRVEPGQRTPPVKRVPPTNRVPPTLREPPPRTPPPPRYPPTQTDTSIRLGKKTDKQQRTDIENAQYAIGYRRGELKGQDVWHVWAYNGREWERVIVRGKAPKGAEIFRGQKSAYKSIQKLSGLRGLPAAVLNENTGAVDTRITIGKGAKPDIEFGKDLSSKASSISERLPEITPRSPNISGRSIRITPKPPRITPPPPRITQPIKIKKWR